MSRVQLALNVKDLQAAVEFYSKVFGARPAKERPGYANFAIVDPPLKLVLFENPAGDALNHLGVEVENVEDVASAAERFRSQGLSTRGEEGVTCCFAVQDKVWVSAGDQPEWEFYTVLSDAQPEVVSSTSSSSCCG